MSTEFLKSLFSYLLDRLKAKDIQYYSVVFAVTQLFDSWHSLPANMLSVLASASQDVSDMS